MSVENQFQPTTQPYSVSVKTTDFMSVENQFQPTTRPYSVSVETTDFMSVENQFQPTTRPQVKSGLIHAELEAHVR